MCLTPDCSRQMGSGAALVLLVAASAGVIGQGELSLDQLMCILAAIQGVIGQGELSLGQLMCILAAIQGVSKVSKTSVSSCASSPLYPERKMSP